MNQVAIWTTKSPISDFWLIFKTVLTAPSVRAIWLLIFIYLPMYFQASEWNSLAPSSFYIQLKSTHFLSEKFKFQGENQIAAKVHIKIYPPSILDIALMYSITYCHF